MFLDDIDFESPSKTTEERLAIKAKRRLQHLIAEEKRWIESLKKPTPTHPIARTSDDRLGLQENTEIIVMGNTTAIIQHPSGCVDSNKNREDKKC